MPVPLPPGLLRLGSTLPAGLHPEAALLSRCAAALGPAVPTGAVLLDGCDDLGPIAPGEHVVLRVLGAHTALRLPTDRAAVLRDGVRTLRLSAPTGASRDVLVLRAAPVVHAGRVALGPPDVARSVEGEAHELDGASEVRELLLRRLGRWERAHRGVDEWRTPLPPWGMRLSRLVRDVLRAVPAAGLTWADDGRRCRLLGVASRA